MAPQSPYPVSSHYRQPQAATPPHPQAGPQKGFPLPHPGVGEPYPVRPGVAVSYGAPQAKPQSRQLLIGGSMLALAALVITPQLNQTQVQETTPFTCLKQENPKAMASRDQIKKLLETDLQTPKATVQEFLKVPYCVLSPGKTEAGQPADREAYPLEFDPQTWLVVLYEGDRFAGYDFRFR